MTETRIDIIDIKGTDKIEVLRLLLNFATKKNWFFETPRNFTYSEVKTLFDKNDTKYFNVIEGRVIKVNLNGNIINLRHYIQANGQAILFQLKQQTNERKENHNKGK